MFDMSELRGRIYAVFKSQKEFAEAVNRSTGFVSNVLNGDTYLDQSEIDKWASVLNIEPEEYPRYFFALKVHKTER